MERILCLIIGYAFGLIQTSYIIGKAKGIDIRSQGSGNAGTTNAMRVLGKKIGFITYFADCIKCIVAVVVTYFIFRNMMDTPLIKLWTAAGVVLGHDFPFYLKFKGGKGIAATSGMMFAFGDPIIIIVGFIAFFVPFFTTHYVSLGSLCLSTSFIVSIIIRGQLGCFGVTQGVLIEMYIIVAILTIIAFVQHRSNIHRLLTGTERKSGVKKKD